MAPNVSTNRENLHDFKIKLVLSDQENSSDQKERKNLLVNIETDVLEINHSGIYSRILIASPSACIWLGYRSGTGYLMCFFFGGFSNLTR